MMIAFALIAIMFMGLGVALMSSMAGTADSRRNQQAADVIAELTEGVRAAQYASVSVKDPAATGGPALTTDPAIHQVSPSSWTADINGTDPDGVEPLVVDAAGVVIPHQVLLRDGARYEVYSYVTLPTGSLNYRRLTQVVKWQQAGTTHVRRSSTFIAETQRGLPLPDFVFKSAMTTLPGGDSPTVDNTSPLNLFVSLTNRGARDAWTITATGKPWSWEYNQASGPDTSALTPLVSATTPLISTDDNMFVNIHVDTLPTAVGGPYPITVRATSVAQPSVYKEVTFNVSIVKLCAGCTYTPLFLHNTTTSAGCTGTPCTDPSSTRVTTDLYADFVSPKWSDSTVPDFDTNVAPTGPGRWLLPGGNISTETMLLGRLMQWRWDAGSTLMNIVPGKLMKVTVCMKNTNSVGGTAITWQVLAQKKTALPVPVTAAVTQSIDGSNSTGFSCSVGTSTVLAMPSGSGNWPLKGSGTNYTKLYLRIVNPSDGAYELAYDTTSFSPTLDLPTP
jgi:type II secretory pathway pseudopilin PulG